MCFHLNVPLGIHFLNDTADEPGIAVGPNTLPFLHFSISTLTLTYHDAQN